MLLADCAPKDKLASLTDGACSAFQAPPYVVKGKATYDQQWIDKQTEAGIEGCGFERPKPRPPSLDAKPITKKAPPANPTPNAIIKKRWWPL